MRRNVFWHRIQCTNLCDMTKDFYVQIWNWHVRNNLKSHLSFMLPISTLTAAVECLALMLWFWWFPLRILALGLSGCLCFVCVWVWVVFLRRASGGAVPLNSGHIHFPPFLFSLFTNHAGIQCCIICTADSTITSKQLTAECVWILWCNLQWFLSVHFNSTITNWWKVEL